MPHAHRHNQWDRQTLIQKLQADPSPRHVVTFYQYKTIDDTQGLRDTLFNQWESWGVLGRVYVAKEGINAQISVPRQNFLEFSEQVDSLFPGIIIKQAIENRDDSFLKLIVRIKKKIVADGLDDDSFDTTKVGNHLSASEFNKAMSDPETIVVDVRNHYESEIGHFEGAICPDVSSFREELPVIREMLEDKKDKKILLYCTGGVRCEKTSAWLGHHGFKDVNQLHGGIIDYVRQVKEENLDNKFIGKNFVFDERLGERVTDDIIAHCHVCDRPSDTHTNCKWQACHILLILCESCQNELEGCCSKECRDFTHLPEDEQKRLRKLAPQNPEGFSKSRHRSKRNIEANRA